MHANMIDKSKEKKKSNILVSYKSVNKFYVYVYSHFSFN